MGSYSNERTIGAAHNNYPSGMNETEVSIANHLPQAAATNCDQKKTSSALSASKMTQNGSVEMRFSARLFETKPDLWIRVRTIGLIGALLPGIGCYICIAYTYLFQLEQVQNFTSTNCENVRSSFPPVSYSIGVWKPQKFLWLLVMVFHFPPRLLFGYIYKSQYKLGKSEYTTRDWYPIMINLQVRTMIVEAIGLIIISIVDIDSAFGVHAVAYTMWIVSFNFNVLFNNILHYHSGIINLSNIHRRIFFIKVAIFLISYPLSVSTGISYFIYVLLCSETAYVTFALAEYILIGCNCLFYFLLIWELTGSRLEFFVTYKNCVQRTEMDVE